MASCVLSLGFPDVPYTRYMLFFLPTSSQSKNPSMPVMASLSSPTTTDTYPEAPEVAAVLDWELTTLGDPFADLAHCCLYYGISAGTSGLSGLLGTDFHASGIPGEGEFLEDYENCSGRKIPAEWGAYMAFAFFRMAAICQGVYKRAIQGNASDAEAHRYGRIARTMAAAGLQRGLSG